MRVRLIQKEKAEVENVSTGKKSWAMKLLFKATYEGKKEPEFLPININGLVDGDDDNVIKRAKKEARKFFVNKNNGLLI